MAGPVPIPGTPGEAPLEGQRRPTMSLCPRCLAVIPAELVVRDKRVLMLKACPSHGPFTDVISSDAAFFMRLESLSRAAAAWTGGGDDTPGDEGGGSSAGPRGCPRDCGLCGRHASRTMMLNIDLTNRCNLRCPICFANAAARGFVYEVTREQVAEMIAGVLRGGAVRPACLQFSGGEPTLHPDLTAILSDARRAGFAQIQVASNGLRFAREPDFARACAEAGLNVVYLQFDGLSDAIYRRTRGRALLDLKLRAVDHIYQAGMRTMLVPTIVTGLNDGEIGPILRYAVEQVDKIAGVSWQPVSFTGRIEQGERLAQRFTLADLARCIEEQTGWVVMHRDWYPYATVEPFCRLIEAVTGQPVAHMTCHGRCGMATYLIVNPATRQVVPLPRLVDVEPLVRHVGRLAGRIERWPRLGRRWRLGLAVRRLQKYHHQEAAPAGWDFEALVRFVLSFVHFGEQYPDNDARRADTESQPWRALLLAAMHFQDVYNYELDRVRRCVVHYAAPDGRLYPFCTYNGGPFHRSRIEARFARRAARFAPAAGPGRTAPSVIG